MNKKIPKELLDRQDKVRQESINKVLHAITDLKAEGYCIKIKDIMEHTGLSRSVLSKHHLRDILIKNGIVQGELKNTDVGKKEIVTKEEKLKAEIIKKDEQNKKLREENSALKSECELLRGRLYLLMQRQLQ